jgi:hypothetical protein
MSEAAHPNGYEDAPGEHECEHFLESFERSDSTGDSLGFHGHAPGDRESQHFLEAFDRSGISEQST